MPSATRGALRIASPASTRAASAPSDSCSQGYLHWLKLSDGAFAARAEAADEAFVAAPVVADGILVAQASDGTMSAWRLSP